MSDYIPNNSVVVYARALYLTYALERATNDFFLELHDMRLRPIHTHEPDVERLSSRSLAQSESL